jgi:hypothetical protein
MERNLLAGGMIDAAQVQEGRRDRFLEQRHEQG